ncbi:MAG: tRNA (adenosine(37)-N6)-threonylcarbamoyltransferase complex ATPase subunit type 1 TsaE [Gammaproteobacteria bacterium]
MPETTCPAAADLEHFAAAFTAAATDGLTIYLQGELGAGKTTFVRGLLRALGYTGAVKSPTYTLVEPYRFGEHAVYHFDFYRFHDPAELESIGHRDYFTADSCCLVEWPERAGALLPEPDIRITLTILPTGRRVGYHGHSKAGQALLDSLPDAPGGMLKKTAG